MIKIPTLPPTSRIKFGTGSKGESLPLGIKGERWKRQDLKIKAYAISKNILRYP
jgi:hypothetical protein